MSVVVLFAGIILPSSCRPTGADDVFFNLLQARTT